MILTCVGCFIFGLVVGIFYKNRFTIEIIHVEKDRTIKELDEINKIGPLPAFKIGGSEHKAFQSIINSRKAQGER